MLEVGCLFPIFLRLRGGTQPGVMLPNGRPENGSASGSGSGGGGSGMGSVSGADSEGSVTPPLPSPTTKTGSSRAAPDGAARMQAAARTLIEVMRAWLALYPAIVATCCRCDVMEWGSHGSGHGPGTAAGSTSLHRHSQSRTRAVTAAGSGRAQRRMEVPHTDDEHRESYLVCVVGLARHAACR